MGNSQFVAQWLFYYWSLSIPSHFHLYLLALLPFRTYFQCLPYKLLHHYFITSSSSCPPLLHSDYWNPIQHLNHHLCIISQHLSASLQHSLPKWLQCKSLTSKLSLGICGIKCKNTSPFIHFFIFPCPWSVVASSQALETISHQFVMKLHS